MLATASIVSLQYLRAMAAMMVVYFHATKMVFHHQGIDEAASTLGLSGVDIFFVISGFIMYYTTTSLPIGPFRFFTKRLIRIVPLYWIATLGMFVMPLVSHTIAGGGRLDMGQLISSLAFIPYPYPADPSHYYPVYVAGWTINYEMFFYLLFSFSLITKNPNVRVFIVGGFLLTLVVLGDVLPPHGLFAFYLSPIMLEFLCGVAIAWCFKSELVLPTGLAVTAVATGAVILLWLQMPSEGLRPLAWGLPSTIAIFGIVSLEQAGVIGKSRSLLLLGDASYSIYLTHLFVVGLAEIAWTKLGLPLSAVWAVIFVVSALVASAFGGIVTYLFLERPILQFLRSIASAHLSTRTPWTWPALRQFGREG